jgi:hypothetical protein
MMGNTVVIFRLFLLSGLLENILLNFSSFAPIFDCTLAGKMDSTKSRSSSAFIDKYIQEQNHSSEEEKEVESFIDEFEPFVVGLRHYPADMPLTERRSQLAKGLITQRKNPLMPYIMSKMFDFDLEIIDIEKDLLSVREKMEPIFNFIDLSFQLIDGPVDEKVEVLMRKLNILRDYYTKRSTLNNSHSEIIVDLFRVCARKDKILSQALEGDFTEFIFDDDDQQQNDAPNQRANALEQETEMDTTNVEPQPNVMEVASQTKLELLCNKKVMTSNFETTLDGLVGMVRALLWNLWIGLVLVLHMTSTNYEMLYAVKQNYVLMQMIYICMDLHILEESQRKSGSVEQLNWLESNSKDTPIA